MNYNKLNTQGINRNISQQYINGKIDQRKENNWNGKSDNGFNSGMWSI